jgi:hypothetical protein
MQLHLVPGLLGMGGSLLLFVLYVFMACTGTSALAAENLCISDSARQNLTEAILVTGDTYREIGKLFEEQPKLDWEPLGDVLHLYKGIISSYPDILTVHKVSEMYFYLMFLQRHMWSLHCQIFHINVTFNFIVHFELFITINPTQYAL